MRIITKGATDQSVELYIVDNTTGLPATGLAYNSSGIDLWYRREGAALVSLTEVTQTVSGAHADGGFVHVANGVYRLDLPDAAFGDGVDHVTVGGTITGYTVYPVTVQLVDRPKVVYVNHDGDSETSGATLAAAIASNPRTTICVSPGRFAMAQGLEPAASVVVRGQGVESTVLEWSGDGGGDVTLTHDCTFERMTLRDSGVAVLYLVAGSVALNDLVLRDVFLDSADIEPIDIGSTSACSLTLERVRMRSNYEWGMSFALAAHTVYANDVEVIVTANGSPDDAKCFRLNSGTVLFGDNIRLLTLEGADAGKAISVLGASSAVLSNCDFGRGEIHIGSEDGYVRMTDCEFDRGKVTGHPERLVDVLSPLQPAVAFRTLGVEADGDLSKVNALDGHTPQTGDSYALANGANGFAAIKTDAATAAAQATAANTRVQTGVPPATPGANGGLPTVNASNQIVGIAGVTFPSGFNDLTIANIQSGLAMSEALGSPDIDVLTDLTNYIVAAKDEASFAKDAAQALPSASDIKTEMEQDGSLLQLTAATVADNLDGKVSEVEADVDLGPVLEAIAGVAESVLSGEAVEGFFANQPAAEAEVDEEAIANAVVEALGEVTGTQPRINRKPDPGFTIQISRRTDGTYKAPKPIRLTAGEVDKVYAFVDMSPLFGSDNYVQTVGAPVVSGGSITAESVGPRDTYAVVELDGTATAGEGRTVTVPVTMTSGTTVPVVFDVEVLE